MAFDSFTAFLHMGGYGGYVWSAFISTFLILGWLYLASVLQSNKLKRDIQAQAAREQRIATAKRGQDESTS